MVAVQGAVPLRLLSHRALLSTPLFTSSSPLPAGTAELISADAVVTEAGCEIRTPGVAAQQACHPSDLTDYYNHTLSSYLDQLTPIKTKTVSSMHSAPWYTPELRVMKTRARQLERLRNKTVSPTDVSKLITGMKTATCTLDPIPSNFVKACLPALSTIITATINSSLFTGIIPPSLKIAAVTPILKKPGLNPDIPNNFRPISNLPFLSKVLEPERIDQELRLQLLREMCDVDKETFSEGKHSLEDMTDKELNNLIVDDNHGIIYCYIPKVACTNWKRVMFVLNQSEAYDDPMSIPGDLVHGKNQLTHLNSFPRTEMKAKLKHYTKFLFVRHPFVRLISAYRDKFMKHNEYFYQNFARDILHLYGNQSDPPKTVDEAFASSVRPSFYNFIQYLLDPQTEKKQPFEPHWRQMTRLCHPCLIQYDFIGHQETLQEDAEELLKLLKLAGDIKFPPSYENMTSADSVLDWYGRVPLEDRRKLYKLYKRDFSLFGYKKPSKLLDG
ncbi:carbohydrate sulfotransferase 12-like [Symphorus nematophorus]